MPGLCQAANQIAGTSISRYLFGGSDGLEHLLAINRAALNYSPLCTIATFRYSNLGSLVANYLTLWRSRTERPPSFYCEGLNITFVLDCPGGTRRWREAH